MYIRTDAATETPKYLVESLQRLWRLEIQEFQKHADIVYIIDITCFKTVIKRKPNGHSAIKFWNVAFYDPETWNPCIARFNISFNFTNIKFQGNEVKFHVSS